MPATYRVPETFNTERFVVRKALVSDSMSVHRGWATDREVTRYLAWKPHSSMEQTVSFLEVRSVRGRWAQVSRC